MNSKFKNSCHKHFLIQYNLQRDKSAWLCVMASKRVIESCQSCFWPFSVNSLWRKRSNTCVWLFLLVGQQKKKCIKKNPKWGLKSHGWLLEPATAFSLMRKSPCSLHLYFLSLLDTGASVKMCSSLQAERWLHFWVVNYRLFKKKTPKNNSNYQKKKNSFVKKMTYSGKFIRILSHLNWDKSSLTGANIE